MQNQNVINYGEQKNLKTKKIFKKKILPHILLILFGIMYFLPFLWLLSTSFKTPDQVFEYPPKWIPDPFAWGNYPKAMSTIPFFTYLKNTVILAVIPIFGQVLSSSLVAYSIAKIPWKGGKKLFGIILATMMLPHQVTMIPLYVTWAKLDMVNTFVPLLVPSFFGGAYNIFLLRQFFKTVPDSLLEAARIDGASEGRIFFQIMLPLSKPVLTTIALFTFMGGWNDFMTPLIYLNDSAKWPLSIGLQAFMIEFDTKWELLMAASVLFTIPMIITFFVGQKQFIEGIVTTGLK
ncbi:MAG: carbohydrate ABC transporter permease [Xylanivirga thermophila]|jgi:multiple sugar transport system permease protein|uniref:carbohydrate ABC transporter permease n=1 Tax=Xylanivirga thermophila TaxID=2496273 RepID=UPI00101D2FB3|nr:carbohydrate ABC transporter permease [Xylanivirga thermophila]